MAGRLALITDILPAGWFTRVTARPRAPNFADTGHPGKVPAVTLAFWVIKIAATTLGETGGDAVSMTLALGYLLSTCIFGLLFLALAGAQIASRKFDPLLYWAAIVATTTAGTTMADFTDRSLGVGYVGGSLILLGLLAVVMAAWRLSEGQVAADRITTRRTEMFYWAAILISNTLGTALGDFLADSGAGYEGGALVFAGMLAIVALLYFTRSISNVLLFWMAFVLTRPLGATLGDFLTKPAQAGGLHLGRGMSSACLGIFILGCLLLLPQRPGGHPGRNSSR